MWPKPILSTPTARIGCPLIATARWTNSSQRLNLTVPVSNLVPIVTRERLDTGLAYDEPWGWMVPSRHALGALLLEQDHVEEATQVFR